MENWVMALVLICFMLAFCPALLAALMLGWLVYKGIGIFLACIR